MSTGVTASWSPNQAAIAQVETYAFTAPNAIGNTYTATINGKSVTYTSVSGDTAATAATGLFNLLNTTTSIPAEMTEITFANPSSGVVTATASVPGTPFANVPGTSAGLVMSTGGGLSNGIATAHTTANASPSDVNDPQNWQRITPGGPTVRALPINGDDVVVANTSVPMLWNLDQLAAVQFNTYKRYQSMTGDIGLSFTNANGYQEWRAARFKFSGPQGSVPAGGLAMTLGFNPDSGSGPGREQYDVGSQLVTVNAIAVGGAEDSSGFAIQFLGVHTDNKFTLTGGVTFALAFQPGTIANVNNVEVANATCYFGPGVTWTTSSGAAPSVLNTFGGTITINTPPATVNGANGTQFTIDGTGTATWPIINVQGGCLLDFIQGGMITTLTMTTGCTLNMDPNGRGTLTITNSTIDGDTCTILDPNNNVIFTNATTVKQAVTSGPFQFTGQRTMKVT